MQQHQIDLVKSSWQSVVPIAGAAADIFYERLFELDASLRPMFPSDLRDQKQKLMTTLGLVISTLDQLDRIMPTLQALARRHARYEVKPEHYALAGRALLATLEIGLGDAWNDDMKSAWSTAYGALSQVMIESSAAPFDVSA
jgi:hemoglobin-like flavoprotein